MKIVINASHGGFQVTQLAAEMMKCGHEKTPWDGYGFGHSGDEKRACSELVRVVEVLGQRAGDDLKIVEIPDGVEWEIIDFRRLGIHPREAPELALTLDIATWPEAGRWEWAVLLVWAGGAVVTDRGGAVYDESTARRRAGVARMLTSGWLPTAPTESAR